jgi:heptosyltransferase-2
MPRNVVVFLPNWIGDTVMATPALRALRKHFAPPATITGVMKPYVQKVLDGTPWLDRILLYDRRSRHPGLRTWPVAKQLRGLHPEVALYLSSSWAPALLGWWSGAPHRVAYARGGRSPLLTQRLPPCRGGPHTAPVSEVDRYLQLAYAVGCPVEEQRLELAVTEEEKRRAQVVWQNLGLDAYPHVVLFNGGSAQGRARHWPDQHYVDLARQILTLPGTAVLLLCGPREQEQADAIERRIGDPRVRSMGSQDLSLGTAKACIRRGRLLVTTDSGPRHIAAAFRTPTVTLFGPIDPRHTVNYNPYEIAVQHSLPCRPCGQDTCPLKHNACMRDLPPQAVYQAVALQLTAVHPQAA